MVDVLNSPTTAPHANIVNLIDRLIALYQAAESHNSLPDLSDSLSLARTEKRAFEIISPTIPDSDLGREFIAQLEAKLLSIVDVMDVVVTLSQAPLRESNAHMISAQRTNFETHDKLKDELEAMMATM